MKNFIKQKILFFIISLLLTILSSSNVINNFNEYVSDETYQKQVAIDDDIVIISIDEKSLKEYGQYQDWNREKIIDTLIFLNESENCRPSVIAIDILYSSEKDNNTDRLLAEAASKYNNVVTASLASFDSDFVEDCDEFKYNNFIISSYEEPYKGLKEGTIQGHINAMLDNDGILRHHLLYFNLNGQFVPSMALAVVEKYDKNFKLPQIGENGFWYLSYSRNPGNFESISIFDVLNKKVPADYFDGKIVLIGPMAMGLQDNYFTSIEHASPMYGVEYQANAILALLNDNLKQEVNNKVQYLILFVVLFCSFLFFSKNSIKISTIGWIISLIFWGLTCNILYKIGFILNVLFVPLFISIVYIGYVAIHAIQEGIKRKQITKTFERYVAPEIVEELLKSDKESLKLGGKTCNIAVLFVDIRGFTTMSEKIKPETVVEILNKYLTLISDCIFRYHGTLDKYVGDAVMAFWGAPLPQDDYVMNAAKAAIDMAAEAKKLSEELQQKYGQGVMFGIGINVGDAVVGNIGSTKRMDYTAIGDTVNTAARLEANAPGNTIYISKEVVDILGSRINATILDNPPKLKGKNNNFEIFTLDSINH